jgi:Protein of unknown function
LSSNIERYLVENPNMKPAELDDLILSIASTHWQKVAMIISKVTRDDRFSCENSDDEFDSVAARITYLVAEGRLESQGDISQWRFSEVRRGS